MHQWLLLFVWGHKPSIKWHWWKSLYASEVSNWEDTSLWYEKNCPLESFWGSPNHFTQILFGFVFELECKQFLFKDNIVSCTKRIFWVSYFLYFLTRVTLQSALLSKIITYQKRKINIFLFFLPHSCIMLWSNWVVWFGSKALISQIIVNVYLVRSFYKRLARKILHLEDPSLSNFVIMNLILLVEL